MLDSFNKETVKSSRMEGNEHPELSILQVDKKAIYFPFHVSSIHEHLQKVHILSNNLSMEMYKNSLIKER